MARPKGSKNKKKEEVKASGVEIKEGVSPLEDIIKGHPVTDWKPEPKIEDSASQECKGCKHHKAKHYGSETDWCNTFGCNCQAYA